jgi:hypothetical protein
MATKIKRILVISDLHIGSIYGLLPPKFITSDEREISQNVGQKYLWECWKHMAGNVGKVDALIVNGDTIDGEQRKQRGTELCLTRMEDQSEAAVMALQYLIKAAGIPKTYIISGCVTPGNKILKSDLSWVDVETVEVGDGLIAPEENVVAGKTRKWTTSTVTAKEIIPKECCRLVFDDGDHVDCTVDHPWLVYNGTGYVWTQAGRMRSRRTRIAKVLSVWGEDASYDSGWLSGFMDGEATLSQFKPRGSYGTRLLLEITQNEGLALERAKGILNDRKFSYSIYDHDARNGGNTRTVHIKGGQNEVMRLLGSVRPTRLMNKFSPDALGEIKALRHRTVVEIKKIGVQEVVGLSTSSHTYVINGMGSHNTPYHDSEAGREAEVVAQRIGAERYKGVGAGRYCRDAMDLCIDGVVVNFSHGISASGALYRGVAPDREAVWSALAGKEGKAARADCLVRSHVHHFVHIEHPSKHAVVTPCWQLQTSFMRKNSLYRMIPDLGYVVININGEAKKIKEDPCLIEKWTYPLPEPRITHL